MSPAELHPLERTRPKGDPDPGWRRIGWDEALEKTAARLLALSRDHGPESVVFSAASPSTSAISDSAEWIDRLRRAFGSPSLCAAIELCAWGRYFASTFTYGAPVPGVYMPDLEHAGCILFWGYNPSIARLAHATGGAEPAVVGCPIPRWSSTPTPPGPAASKRVIGYGSRHPTEEPGRARQGSGPRGG